MPTITPITKQGSFDADVASQINTNFTNLNAASGTGTPTGSGAAVLANSPTLVTPDIGAATATSLVSAGKLVGASVNFIAAASETGANNALVVALTGGPTLAAGLVVTIQLAHTLQAGANTINYNGAGVVNIKSSRNAANNIGTAYAATGIITLIFDGTAFLDVSQ